MPLAWVVQGQLAENTIYGIARDIGFNLNVTLRVKIVEYRSFGKGLL